KHPDQGTFTGPGATNNAVDFARANMQGNARQCVRHPTGRRVGLVDVFQMDQNVMFRTEDERRAYGTTKEAGTLMHRLSAIFIRAAYPENGCHTELRYKEACLHSGTLAQFTTTSTPEVAKRVSKARCAISTLPTAIQDASAQAPRAPDWRQISGRLAHRHGAFKRRGNLQQACLLERAPHNI